MTTRAPTLGDDDLPLGPTERETPEQIAERIMENEAYDYAMSTVQLSAHGRSLHDALKTCNALRWAIVAAITAAKEPTNG